MTQPGDATRRRFLKAAGFSALFLQLEATRRAFAEDLPEPAELSSAASPFAGLRQEYGLNPDVVYLNHASIGTMPNAVRRAHWRYLELCETNPWLYMWGDAWEEPLAAVRKQAAEFIGADASEVTFSHNTTETFNLLAQGLPLGPGDEVLFSSLNHSGASVCWFHQAESRGFKVRRFDFPILEVPEMTAEDVVACHIDAIRPETRVLVLPHIDNTVGLRHPVRDIARAARRRGVEFVAVDAAQSIAMLPVDVAKLEVDVYACSAHKWIQAPKGLGLAYVSTQMQKYLRPMWVTWGQKSWADSARKYEDYGTRNLAEVLTLGHALDFQRRLGDSAPEHHRGLWAHAQRRVEENSKLRWHSPQTWPLSAALYSVGLDGVPASQLAKRLFASSGLVFRPFEVHGLNAIRLSPNALNTIEELDRLFDALKSLT